MAKKKKQECPAGEKWAVPYADFLSLLLALFIALYAISAQNKAKVEALKMEFIKIFDSPPKPDTVQPVKRLEPDPGDIEETTEGEKSFQAQMSHSVKSVESIIQIQQLVQEGGVLEQIEQGIALQLPSDLLFNRDSADITDREMRDYVRDIANIIKKFPPQIKINVRGFTDDSPMPANAKFKDHFTLAAARAAAVMRMLIEDGVNPNALSFSSYGKNGSAFPNTTIQNRLKNNRVEIYLSADPNNVKNIESLLDKAKQ